MPKKCSNFFLVASKSKFQWFMTNGEERGMLIAELFYVIIRQKPRSTNIVREFVTKQVKLGMSNVIQEW